MNAPESPTRPTLTLKRPKQIIINPAVTAKTSDEQPKKKGVNAGANNQPPRANVPAHPQRPQQAKKEPAMWCRRGVDPDFVGYVLTKDQRKAIDKMLDKEKAEAQARKEANLKREAQAQANKKASKKHLDRAMRRIYPMWGLCLPLYTKSNRDVIEAIKAIAPDVSTTIARELLVWHVNSSVYLKNVVKGGKRYTLDGEEVGDVSQVDIDYSRNKLAQYRARGERMAKERWQQQQEQQRQDRQQQEQQTEQVSTESQE